MQAKEIGPHKNNGHPGWYRPSHGQVLCDLASTSFIPSSLLVHLHHANTKMSAPKLFKKYPCGKYPIVLCRPGLMKQLIKYSVVAISALFVAVGCGGDSEGGDENSTSQAEPTAPAGAEFVYLKVDGMS